MKINTNRWNKIRYTIYAPFYDVVEKVFSSSRRRSVEMLDLQPGDRLLIIGGGTGLDLKYLPKDIQITATDITPAMVSRMQKRAKKLDLRAKVEVMDGQQLAFEDNLFDKVILHLILAVIPDPVQCLREAERVLKQDGVIMVFDKFAKKEKKISLFRKALNFPANLFFSNINRQIEDIVAATGLKIEKDIDVHFNGNFRLIKLKRKG